MNEIENRSDGSCATCCTMIDGDGVVAGLRLLCRRCAGFELDALRVRLAAAEARASELTSMLQAREAQRDEALARVDEEHQRAERLAAVVQAQIDAKQIEWEDQLTVTPKMIADNLGWSLAAPGWEQEKAAWLGLLPGDVKDGHYER